MSILLTLLGIAGVTLIILGFTDMLREKEKTVQYLLDSNERNRFKIRDLLQEMQKIHKANKPKRKYKRRLKK